MVKVRIPVPDPQRATTSEEARKLVRQANIKHAVCATRLHKWPEFDLSKGKLPAGFVVGPIRSDGLIDVTEHCTRKCGETRRYLTTPERVFAAGHKRAYNHPEGRPVIARGVGRAVWAEKLAEAWQGPITAAAKRATEAADRAAAEMEQSGGTVHKLPRKGVA